MKTAHVQQGSRIIKFIYSEKATNFCEISTIDLSYVVTVQSKVGISQNFVAFLEYMNFKQNRTKWGKYFTCQRRLAWGCITVIPRIICHNCSIMKIYWQHKRILHNPFHNCSGFRLPRHSDLEIENSIRKFLVYYSIK